VSVRVAKVSFRHNSNGRNGDSGVGYEEPSDLIITDGTVLFKLHLKKIILIPRLPWGRVRA
jgi:hypothetical protein